jgi:signal transduction histidine kinase
MDALHQFFVDYVLNICGGLFIAIAVVIFRANALRAANVAFALLVFAGGIWTINYGFIARHDPRAVFHLRLGATIASFLPATFLLTRNLIANPHWRLRRDWKPIALWIGFGVVLAAVTTLDWFIRHDSLPDKPVYGPGWFWQHIAISAAMAYIAASGWRLSRKLQNSARVEMRLAVVAACCAVATISAFLALLNSSAALPPAANGVVATVYASYLIWVLLVRGIYDTRSLLNILARTVCVMVGGTVTFLLIDSVLEERAGMNRTAAAIVASVIAAIIVNYITTFFLARHNALLYRSIAGFQREVNEVARSALTQEKAIAALEAIIAEYANTSTALIFSEVGRGVYRRGALQINNHPLNWQRINRSGWLTRDALDPERLASSGSGSWRWMEEHGVTLLMLGPPSEQHLNLIIAFGRRQNAPAYTFYELECISLMVESAAIALTTIEASAQAQHAGQMMALGMISASVVHEIKQPLAALRLFFKMLPTRYDDERFRSEYFEVIPNELARIEVTLSQLLRLGRTESYNIGAFAPASIIREVLTLIHPQASSSSIEIVPQLADDHHRMLGDPLVLKQALLNLALNAIQALASTRDAWRMLYVSSAVRDARFEITIRDTGPGISPVVLEKLFRPFVSTKEDGFGLGLYITRDQVVKTGGELLARNDPRGGAVFLLSFPLAVAPLPEASAVGNAAGAA